VRRAFIEVRVGGTDDPDGSRAASVLTAYFHAECMRAFRRSLWRRLAILAAIFLAAAAVASLPERDVLIGAGLLGGAGVWAAILEWRAAQRLHALTTR
jgi:hypothetical protein